jgi:hypothetical protein
LCSWFIANICGTGLLGILSKRLIVFILFYGKEEKEPMAKQAEEKDKL